MIILIDMDDTLCQFTKKFCELFHQEMINFYGYCDEFLLESIRNRKYYHIKDNINIEYSHIVDKVLLREDFLLTLKPYDNAIETIKNLMKYNCVYFCSSPLKISPEKSSYFKHLWIKKYFGSSNNLILTNDKTIINGDYLIDDHPMIDGINKNNVMWKQIFFTQSHNINIDSQYRVSTWKEIDILFSTLEKK